MSGLPWQFTDREGDPLRLVPSTKEAPTAPGTQQRVYYIETVTPLTSMIDPNDANLPAKDAAEGELAEDEPKNKTGIGRGTFKTMTRLRSIPLSQFNQAFISVDNPVMEGVRQDTFVSAHTGQSFFFLPMGRALPARIIPNPSGTDYIWEDVTESTTNKTKPDSSDYIVRIPRALPWDESSDTTPFKWAKNNITTTTSNVILVEENEVTLSKGYQTALDNSLAKRQIAIDNKESDLAQLLKKLFPSKKKREQQAKIDAAKSAFLQKLAGLSKERLFLDGFGIADPTGSGKSDYDLTAAERDERNTAWRNTQNKMNSTEKQALALQIELDSLILAKEESYFSNTKSPWLNVINIREMFSTLQSNSSGRTLVLYKGTKPLALEGATVLWGPTTIISTQPVYVLGSLMWNPAILPTSVKNMLPKVGGISVADMENPFVLSAPTIFFVSADAIGAVLRSPSSAFTPAPGTEYEQPRPSEGDYALVVSRTSGNKEAYEESQTLFNDLDGLIAGQADSLVPLAAKLKAAETALDALTPSSTPEETASATALVASIKAEIQTTLGKISSKLEAYGDKTWTEADKLAAYSSVTSDISNSLSTSFSPVLAFSTTPASLTGTALESALQLTGGVSAYTTRLKAESNVLLLSLYEEKRTLDQLGANPDNGAISDVGLSGIAPFTASASSAWWQDYTVPTAGIDVDFPVPSTFTTEVAQLYRTLSGYNSAKLRDHRDALVRRLLQNSGGDEGLPSQ